MNLGNRWTPIVLAASGFAAVAGAELTSSPPPSTASRSPVARLAPRLLFAEQTFDFGKIKAGDVVRHEFVFTNAGDGPLEITRVVPGCGCTTVTVPNQRVAPGQRGVIPVEFNSRGINGTTQRSISVLANDPARSNVVLKIQAVVWTPVEIQPSIAVFYHDPESPKSETKVLRVLNHLEAPVEISVAEWTNRSFQVALETVRPGREFALKITSVPPLGTGTVTLPLLLKTSAAEAPSLKAYVCAIEQPPVLIAPGQFTVPAGPLAAPEQRAVMVRCLGREPLRLSQLELDLPGVESKVHEIQPGRLFSIVLNFPSGFVLPANESVENRTVEVRVHSNHPRYPVIRIPVGPPALGQTAQTKVQKPENQNTPTILSAK
ncbi:MAG: DUF1573 domain-containing protein [Verrucomicrobia bacterium]|nr:DUF1573 domain-containing protein [Verrucomicrobiota bacterium]